MKNSSNQEIVLNYLFWGTFASIEGGAREIWNIKSVPPTSRFRQSWNISLFLYIHNHRSLLYPMVQVRCYSEN